MAQRNALHCDDPWQDYRYDKPRAFRPSDHLTPTPPNGWIRTIHGFGADHPREIACWFFLIQSVQIAAKENGMKLHHVARDQRGMRVLLVHPCLRDDITRRLEELCSILEQCDCGGECIEPVAQEKATRVLAMRRWRSASPAERIDILLTAEDNGELPNDVEIGMLADADVDTVSSENRYMLWNIAME